VRRCYRFRRVNRIDGALGSWLVAISFLACGGSSGADQPGQGAPASECVFELDARVSEAVGTVGIVEWSLDLPDLKSAHIEFGLDEHYEMTAPVDLVQPSYRTLLLGMKAARTYHFRIQATDGIRVCRSDDHTLDTGDLPSSLLPVSRNTLAGAEPMGGFLVSGFLEDGPAFILDADGDYVFAYGAGEMGRVRMSYGGTHLWYASVNVAGGSASMKRVSMDGLEELDLTAEFGDLHHDFTVLPDETVAFIRHGDTSDSIAEYHPDGSVTEVLNLRDVFGETERTHANALQYSESEDSYTVSDLTHEAFVKFTRQGEVSWVLGGDYSDYSGAGAAWDGQHGHQLLGADRILLFNNGPFQATSAKVLEVTLDSDAMTATRAWEYVGGERSLIYGDVQRSSGGHTLVTFSVAGVIHELGPDGALVEVLTWDIGGAVGYVTKRASLYGPP
jgi:hypothetical protein